MDCCYGLLVDVSGSMENALTKHDFKMVSNVVVYHKGGALLYDGVMDDQDSTYMIPIHQVIKTKVLSDKGDSDSLIHDSFALKWTFSTTFDLVFVVVYRSFLTLLFIDDYLKTIKDEFIKMFHDTLTGNVSSIAHHDYSVYYSVYSTFGAEHNRIDKEYTKQSGTRGKVVFNTIFNVIQDMEQKHSEDENENDTLFALGFGLCDADHQHCDLITLFEYLLASYDARANCIAMLREYGLRERLDQYITTKFINNNEVCQIIGHEPLTKMAAKYDAPHTGEYIEKHLSRKEAGHLFCQFHHNQDLIPPMVRDLPAACKSGVAHGAVNAVNAPGHGVAVGAVGAAPGIFAGAAIGSCVFPGVGTIIGGAIGGLVAGGGALAGREQSQQEESERARKVLRKAKDRVLSPIYNLSQPQRARQEAVRIIDRVKLLYSNKNDDEEKKEDTFDIDKLIDDIKSYIFGGTPMCQSLHYTRRIFSAQSNQSEKRLLIISDGEATDGDPIPLAMQLQQDPNMIVMCCFITDKKIENPKQLFDEDDMKHNQFSEGAEVMFRMASSVSNSDSALIFLQSSLGWTLSKSSKSKLFVQANHPEIIEQFCAVINRVAHANDAVMGMIGRYHLDQFINKTIANKHAPSQKKDESRKFEFEDDGTCYANASAMGMHLAMCRIQHRDKDDVTDFESLREEIIAKHGTNGYSTRKVLKEYCPQYGLRYQMWKPLKESDKDDGKEGLDAVVREIICQRRPLVATFKLQNPLQWAKFTDFFRQNPTGILTKKDLQINMKDEEIDGLKGGSHAVVLIRCQRNCLVFMNSWGTDWADNGFFRIQNTDVLRKMRFFDVYWTLDDLSDDQKSVYHEYCKDKTDLLVAYVPASCYQASYECPLCNEHSKINEYSGHFLKAKCPKCEASFKPNAIGLVRSLYDSQITK
eukprot:282830_1